MAGDWIKMRTDLYRHPKVIVIADLLSDPDSDLSRYVNQNLQRDMTVTRNALRNVTVGALVTVWGVTRHRGYRNGDDLRLDGVTISVVDDICEIPGFGQAMQAVGWLVEDDLGLCFPRFFDEYNVDPEESKKTKATERQRRYRERKKAENGDVTVTSRVTSPSRTEKEVEEEKSNKKENTKRKKTESASEYTSEFEEFWEACPKKVGKGNAWRAWPKARKLAAESPKRIDGESVAEFLTRRMRDYRASVADKDAQYVRHPATWLNGGNWDDETGSRVPTDEDLKNWRG